MRISDWSSDVCSSDLFRLVEAEARTDFLRHLGAKLRMVAAAALGDVVQQHRHVEHTARQDLVHHLGGDRRHLGQAALLDRVQNADGEDGVLIDRVRSEEHTSELQSLMRISYAVFCLKKKKK